MLFSGSKFLRLLCLSAETEIKSVATLVVCTSYLSCPVNFEVLADVSFGPLDLQPSFMKSKYELTMNSCSSQVI